MITHLAAFAAVKKDESSHMAKILPRSGQASCFDGDGNLVDFAGSGQDGEFQRGVVWQNPRFTANDDGTVTDTLTGLMWLKDSACLGKLPWSVALGKIKSLNEQDVTDCKEYSAKFNDWFLPNINQLSSLLNFEEQVYSDYLKIQGVAVSADQYWSSTSYQNLLNAWSVDFNTGSISFQNKMKQHHLVAARVHDLSKNTILGSGQVQSLMVGDDGELKYGLNVGQGRFVNNSDGTTTDTLTGLMWLQEVDCLGKKNWQSAISAVADFNSGKEKNCQTYKASYQDWFLPNQVELRSLINYSKDYPALDSPEIISAISGQLWSSTSYTAHSKQAFSLDLGTGVMQGINKGHEIHVVPARYVIPEKFAERTESLRDANINVSAKYLLHVDPELRKEMLWPPEPRFLPNGDGTILDIVTGINWLSDANCFGKISWEDARFSVINLNREPSQYSCLEELAEFGDWQMPTEDELTDLLGQQEDDSAIWLTEQGVKNVQDGGDYWTVTETPLNLYFAHVVNLKHGGVRNYPKSLRFYLWPHRALVESPDRQPLLTMSINGVDSSVQLTTGTAISIMVNLHSYALRNAADFWFWYETPAGDRLWMTPIRTWQDEVNTVFQGDLFNLSNYEIFKSSQNNLAPGEYTFHFAVDLNQDGKLDELRHEATVAVSIQ